MAIAGIDIGTTGCKCSVYSREGELLNEAYREYPSWTTDHVLDATLVWENTKAILKEAASTTEALEAIGVTSFGEALVLLDENSLPLAPSMLYTHPKGTEQCEQLVNHFGQEYLAYSTGLNPGPMYSIPKLMYFKEQYPELWSKCRSISLFGDYIVYMLSGIRQIDYSLASRTMAFDINRLQWNEEILEYAGTDMGLWPAPVPIGTPAGTIRKSLAEELGIHEGAIIVSGCHDQVAAAIGTGVCKPGMAVDGTGTVECITPVFDNNIEREPLHEGSYAIVPFLNNQYVTYAFSFTGGALLKWYRDKLANMEAGFDRDEGGSPYHYFNSKVDTTRPSGLLVLPHFSGAATPYMDAESRGAIIGLTTDTTSTDIYQGLMEGVTYEMLLNMERLMESGIEISTIRATGGGALSTIWLQMKADILNRPVISLGAAQSGTLGCIMLAGVACGIYESIDEAEEILVHVKETYVPNREKHKQYMVLYQKYKKIYGAVKDILTA